VGARARSNLVDHAEENWSPPRLEGGRGAFHRTKAAFRRYFDLQAGSIWRDLSELLADARGKVVDVGCGGQPYRSLMPQGIEYVGIDIAEAKEHFGYEAPGTVYFSGTTWPDEASGADFVLCTEALEHVLDPPRFLAEAHRCLKPGGRMLLTVPFAARWHFIPHDYWRFTPSSLKHLLEGAGFEDIEVFARGNALTVACYKTMALFLPLLAPQGSSAGTSLLLRAMGVTTSPLFVLLAAIANVSLGAKGGDDCLGYTIAAKRPASASH
jgi:SAM-dependent methyltransferase